MKNLTPKQQKIRIAAVDPKAKSLRSMEPGIKTWLFDESYFEMLQPHGKHIEKFLRDPNQQTSKNQLTTLASKGWLVGIDHEPEIVDSDGVPGVDFVTCRSLRKKPPKDGFWYDPIEAVLSLPSGKLCVAYDETIFARGALGETECLKFLPGFYKLSVFTRVFDSAFPGGEKMEIPDLAIYLKKSELLQHPFRPTAATVPIHPPEQDLAKLKRRIYGVPDPPDQKPSFKVKQGRCETTINYVDSIGMLQIVMKPKDRKRFGFEEGRVTVLTIGEGKTRQSLHVIIAPEKGFDPKTWPGIDRLKRKVDNLAHTRVAGDHVFFEIIKESRKNPLDLKPGLQTAAVLELTDTEYIDAKSSSKKANKSSAVAKKFQIDKKLLCGFVNQLEKADSWTLAFLFDRKGASFLGAICIHPPQELTSRSGKKETLAAGITAAWGKFRGGDEVEKTFRGYPDGIERALKWVHQQAINCQFSVNRTELEINAPRKYKIDRHQAKRDAKQLGIEVFTD